jgi:GGDEF domain-containing protein
MAAFTARQGMPLACAVFQPLDGVLTSVAADRLAMAFRRTGRISDAVCRTGPVEFTVFAPATDETGAEGLVQRITDAVSRSVAVKLRAGFSTTPATLKRPSRGATATDLHQPPPTSTTDLVDRARKALH